MVTPPQARTRRLKSGSRPAAAAAAAFGANRPTVLQPRLHDASFFLVELRPDRLLADHGQQAIVSIQRPLCLHHVVGLHLGGRVDGRQTAADHDRGQAELQVRQAVRLVGAGGLQSHEEVGGEAHAAEEVILHGDQRRLPRAGADGDMIESQVPGIIQRQSAAEADAVVEAEFLAPHQQQVVDVEEILVPADRDAVLGDAAEAKDGAALEGARDVVDVLDRLWHAPLRPSHRHGQRLDAQAVDADHAEALVQQVVRQRVARRPHAHHQDVLAVVSQRIGPTEIQRVPSRQERVNLEAKRQTQHVRQDARLDLRNVDRRLLLVDARLHAVVADAMARAGAERVVHHDHGQRTQAVPFALQKVSFGNLLVERTARQLDAERVFLGGAVGFAQSLGAGILVARMADDAVVHLAEGFAGRHAQVGEAKTVAMPPSVGWALE